MAEAPMSDDVDDPVAEAYEALAEIIDRVFLDTIKTGTTGGSYAADLRSVLTALSSFGPVVVDAGVVVGRLVEADRFASLRFNGSVKYVYDRVDAEASDLDLVPLYVVSPIGGGTDAG